MRKVLAWLATGLVLGLSIHAWLAPAVESPLDFEPAANGQAAGALGAGDYSGLTRRIGALEV